MPRREELQDEQCAADGHIGAFVIDCPEPLRGGFLCLLYGFKQVLIEPPFGCTVQRKHFAVACLVG